MYQSGECVSKQRTCKYLNHRKKSMNSELKREVDIANDNETRHHVDLDCNRFAKLVIQTDSGQVLLQSREHISGVFECN